MMMKSPESSSLGDNVSSNNQWQRKKRRRTSVFSVDCSEVEEKTGRNVVKCSKSYLKCTQLSPSSIFFLFCVSLVILFSQVNGVCVWQRGGGFRLACGFRQSGLFRIRSLGGLKGWAGAGFTIGDEDGFKDSLTNADTQTKAQQQRQQQQQRNRGLFSAFSPPAQQQQPQQTFQQRQSQYHRQSPNSVYNRQNVFGQYSNVNVQKAPSPQEIESLALQQQLQQYQNLQQQQQLQQHQKLVAIPQQQQQLQSQPQQQQQEALSRTGLQKRSSLWRWPLSLFPQRRTPGGSTQQQQQNVISPIPVPVPAPAFNHLRGLKRRGPFQNPINTIPRPPSTRGGGGKFRPHQFSIAGYGPYNIAAIPQGQAMSNFPNLAAYNPQMYGVDSSSLDPQRQGVPYFSPMPMEEQDPLTADETKDNPASVVNNRPYGLKLLEGSENYGKKFIVGQLPPAAESPDSAGMDSQAQSPEDDDTIAAATAGYDPNIFPDIYFTTTTPKDKIMLLPDGTLAKKMLSSSESDSPSSRLKKTKTKLKRVKVIKHRDRGKTDRRRKRPKTTEASLPPLEDEVTSDEPSQSSTSTSTSTSTSSSTTPLSTTTTTTSTSSTSTVPSTTSMGTSTHRGPDFGESMYYQPKFQPPYENPEDALMKEEYERNLRILQTLRKVAAGLKPMTTSTTTIRTTSVRPPKDDIDEGSQSVLRKFLGPLITNGYDPRFPPDHPVNRDKLKYLTTTPSTTTPGSFFSYNSFYDPKNHFSKNKHPFKSPSPPPSYSPPPPPNYQGEEETNVGGMGTEFIRLDSTEAQTLINKTKSYNNQFYSHFNKSSLPSSTEGTSPDIYWYHAATTQQYPQRVLPELTGSNYWAKADIPDSFTTTVASAMKFDPSAEDSSQSPLLSDMTSPRGFVGIYRTPDPDSAETRANKQLRMKQMDTALGTNDWESGRTWGSSYIKSDRFGPAQSIDFVTDDNFKSPDDFTEYPSILSNRASETQTTTTTTPEPTTVEPVMTRPPSNYTHARKHKPSETEQSKQHGKKYRYRVRSTTTTTTERPERIVTSVKSSITWRDNSIEKMDYVDTAASSTSDRIDFDPIGTGGGRGAGETMQSIFPDGVHDGTRLPDIPPTPFAIQPFGQQFDREDVPDFPDREREFELHQRESHHQQNIHRHEPEQEQQEVTTIIEPEMNSEPGFVSPSTKGMHKMLKEVSELANSAKKSVMGMRHREHERPRHRERTRIPELSRDEQEEERQRAEEQLVFVPKDEPIEDLRPPEESQPSSSPQEEDGGHNETPSRLRPRPYIEQEETEVSPMASSSSRPSTTQQQQQEERDEDYRQQQPEENNNERQTDEKIPNYLVIPPILPENKKRPLHPFHQSPQIQQQQQQQQEEQEEPPTFERPSRPVNIPQSEMMAPTHPHPSSSPPSESYYTYTHDDDQNSESSPPPPPSSLSFRDRPGPVQSNPPPMSIVSMSMPMMPPDFNSPSPSFFNFNNNNNNYHNYKPPPPPPPTASSNPMMSFSTLGHFNEHHHPPQHQQQQQQQMKPVFNIPQQMLGPPPLDDVHAMKNMLQSSSNDDNNKNAPLPSQTFVPPPTPQYQAYGPFQIPNKPTMPPQFEHPFQKHSRPHFQPLPPPPPQNQQQQQQQQQQSQSASFPTFSSNPHMGSMNHPFAPAPRNPKPSPMSEILKPIRQMLPSFRRQSPSSRTPPQNNNNNNMNFNGPMFNTQMNQFAQNQQQQQQQQSMHMHAMRFPPPPHPHPHMNHPFMTGPIPAQGPPIQIQTTTTTTTTTTTPPPPTTKPLTEKEAVLKALETLSKVKSDVIQSVVVEKLGGKVPKTVPSSKMPPLSSIGPSGPSPSILSPTAPTALTFPTTTHINSIVEHRLTSETRPNPQIVSLSTDDISSLFSSKGEKESGKPTAQSGPSKLNPNFLPINTGSAFEAQINDALRKKHQRLQQQQLLANQQRPAPPTTAESPPVKSHYNKPSLNHGNEQILKGLSQLAHKLKSPDTFNPNRTYSPSQMDAMRKLLALNKIEETLKLNKYGHPHPPPPVVQTHHQQPNYLTSINHLQHLAATNPAAALALARNGLLDIQNQGQNWKSRQGQSLRPLHTQTLQSKIDDLSAQQQQQNNGISINNNAHVQNVLTNALKALALKKAQELNPSPNIILPQQLKLREGQPASNGVAVDLEAILASPSPIKVKFTHDPLATKWKPRARLTDVKNAPKSFAPGDSELQFDTNTNLYTDFQCEDQKYFPGLYADPALSCKVFHLCAKTDTGYVRKSFRCPQETVFDQEVLRCNWNLYVDCSGAESKYNFNKYLSQSFQFLRILGEFSASYKPNNNGTVSAVG